MQLHRVLFLTFLCHRSPNHHSASYFLSYFPLFLFFPPLLYPVFVRLLAIMQLNAQIQAHASERRDLESLKLQTKIAEQKNEELNTQSKQVLARNEKAIDELRHRLEHAIVCR